MGNGDSSWAVRPQDRQRYDQIFNSLGPINERLPGNKVSSGGDGVIRISVRIIGRDAPDSGFRYPAGYRIGRIVKNYPAG